MSQHQLEWKECIKKVANYGKLCYNDSIVTQFLFMQAIKA